MHDGSPTASGRLKGSVHRVLLTQRRSPSPSVDMRCAALRADTLRSEMLERAQSDFTMQSEDFPALPGFRAAQARLMLPAWDSPHICAGTVCTLAHVCTGRLSAPTSTRIPRWGCAGG
jgi:hypothetical protein